MTRGEHLGATDTYRCLASEAQGQCRATLPTLANIANGPQIRTKLSCAREENENPQKIELLTNSRTTHGKPLDTRAKSKAGRVLKLEVESVAKELRHFLP